MEASAKRTLGTSSDSNAAAASTPTSKLRPPPSSSSSSDETLFRLLCPSDKTGAVIGKGGSIVRQIREETLAKVRIDDPVAGSDDRVILISAAAAETSSSSSPAQAALVRVFERISAEEKEAASPATCRLLAAGTQVGCVLGKGGKVVEKIRAESGAQVRVLGKEQVPACASAGDEVIQITGSFLAVRKALLSVSSCLQENPRAEATNPATTKSYGSSIRGPGLPTLLDPYAHRTYLPTLQDYNSRTYSSNPRVDVIASGHRKVQEEDIMFRMICSNERVGGIIGKAGIIVRALQNETGASIKVADPVSNSDERIIAISARENSEQKHSPAQEAVLLVHTRLTEAVVDKGSLVSARLLVPAQQIGCLLGRGGSIIADMRRATAANIRIFSKEQVPKCAEPNDEVVQVIGTFQSVQDALLRITSRIRETIFLQKPFSSAGMAQYPSATPEISPVPRTRNESTLGLSHVLDSPIGISNLTDPPLTHGVDRHGTDRVPFSYGAEMTGLRHCHSSSPRAWASQASIYK
ncbi:KH domain-containing protein HEN4 isoform X2 [Iris pallida]|uniref:KH domain-containing protein HEN4 isoform X2 n=1 Tax=Iris pallida TaxID=29817 RepID=A0AAX6FCG1_IRIPA|nr:KH domain-containing protein HEN4 isoform X2 [Iris pallida]KAJ6813863.1 KH domain-containing protein HEN4 isoform X2 [Iris pallida]